MQERPLTIDGIISACPQAWTERLFFIQLALRRLRPPLRTLLYDQEEYRRDLPLIELREQFEDERVRRVTGLPPWLF